jgi:hypothetical protein
MSLVILPNRDCPHDGITLFRNEIHPHRTDRPKSEIVEDRMVVWNTIIWMVRVVLSEMALILKQDLAADCMVRLPLLFRLDPDQKVFLIDHLLSLTANG